MFEGKKHIAFVTVAWVRSRWREQLYKDTWNFSWEHHFHHNQYQMLALLCFPDWKVFRRRPVQKAPFSFFVLNVNRLQKSLFVSHLNLLRPFYFLTLVLMQTHCQGLRLETNEHVNPIILWARLGITAFNRFIHVWGALVLFLSIFCFVCVCAFTVTWLSVFEEVCPDAQYQSKAWTRLFTEYTCLFSTYYCNL